MNGQRRMTAQTDGKATCCAPYQSHGQSVRTNITRYRSLAVAADSARQKILVGESKAVGSLTCTLDMFKREQNLRM